MFIYGIPERPSLQEQSKEPWRHENGHHTVGTDNHDRHVWTSDQWDRKARQPLHAPKRWPLRSDFVTWYLSLVRSEKDYCTKLNCSVNVLNTLASLYDLSSLIYEQMKSWHPLYSTRHLSCFDLLLSEKQRIWSYSACGIALWLWRGVTLTVPRLCCPVLPWPFAVGCCGVVECWCCHSPVTVQSCMCIVYRFAVHMHCACWR